MKIFMGDTGSLLLGFVIAFLGLKFYDLNINGEFYRIDAAPAVFLGIVFIPAFDTVRVFCVRMAAAEPFALLSRPQAYPSQTAAHRPDPPAGHAGDRRVAGLLHSARISCCVT